MDGPRIRYRSPRPGKRLAELGTPAWCSLANDDPRKWAALLDASEHWALRVDTCQEARCEASSDISALPIGQHVGRSGSTTSSTRRIRGAKAGGLVIEDIYRSDEQP